MMESRRKRRLTCQVEEEEGRGVGVEEKVDDVSG